MKIAISVFLGVLLSVGTLSADNERVAKPIKNCDVKTELAESKNLKIIVRDENDNNLAGVSILSGRDGKIYTTNDQGECEIPGLRKNDELTFKLDGFKTSVLIFDTEIYSTTIYYCLTKGKKSKREVKHFYDPLRK